MSFPNQLKPILTDKWLSVYTKYKHLTLSLIFVGLSEIWPYPPWTCFVVNPKRIFIFKQDQLISKIQTEILVGIKGMPIVLTIELEIFEGASSDC